MNNTFLEKQNVLNTTQLNTNILTNKVKVFLSNLGMSERYNAFQYLTFFIVYMIKANDSSVDTYNKCFTLCSQRFCVDCRSITYGLSKVLKMCNLPNFCLFNIKQTKFCNLNKIKIIKDMILNSL